MSRLEEHFKDSLTRAVANEPPVMDAWDRFERRARRGRRSRFAAAIVGVAAVAAASAVAIPRLLPDRTEVISPPPLPTAGVTEGPTGSPTPNPYAGWQRFSNELHHYALRYPSDWRVTSFEDVYEVVAPGQVSSPAGEPTMSISLAYLNEKFDDVDRLRSAGFDRSTRPDGRAFVWREERASDGSGRLDYRFDWSDDCSDAADCTPHTLVVTIYIGTEQLRREFEMTARWVVDSIEFSP